MARILTAEPNDTCMGAGRGKDAGNTVKMRGLTGATGASSGGGKAKDGA